MAGNRGNVSRAAESTGSGIIVDVFQRKASQIVLRCECGYYLLSRFVCCFEKTMNCFYHFPPVFSFRSFAICLDSILLREAAESDFIETVPKD